MFVKLTKCVQDETGIHSPGDVVDLPVDCVENLLARGIVEKIAPVVIVEPVIGLFGETVVPTVEVTPEIIAPKKNRSKKIVPDPEKVADLFSGDDLGKIPESVRAKLLEQGIENKSDLETMDAEDLVCLVGLTLEEAEKTLEAIR